MGWDDIICAPWGKLLDSTRLGCPVEGFRMIEVEQSESSRWLLGRPFNWRLPLLPLKGLWWRLCWRPNVPYICVPLPYLLGTGWYIPSTWWVELNGGSSDSLLLLVELRVWFADDVGDAAKIFGAVDEELIPRNAVSTSLSQISNSKLTAPGGQFPPLECAGDPKM